MYRFIIEWVYITYAIHIEKVHSLLLSRATHFIIYKDDVEHVYNLLQFVLSDLAVHSDWY